MKYSIIIPAYHAQNTILDCLKSIGSQLTDTEVIIVSDERDEQNHIETGTVVETYVQEQHLTESIRYIRNEKEHGVSGARNTGLEHAKGDYIWFVDSDDRVDANWKACWDKATQVDTEIFIAGYENWDGETRTELKKCVDADRVVSLHEFVKTYLQKLKETWFINAVWNKLFRRDFLLRHQVVFPKNGTMGEDLCFCMDAIAAANSIELIEDIIYQYIQRTNQDNACALFHYGAIDMTCYAWRVENNIYQKEQLEMPKSELCNYQEAVDAYLQDLVIVGNGHYKDYRIAVCKIEAADICRNQSEGKWLLKYFHYKCAQIRKDLARIKGKIS